MTWLATLFALSLLLLAVAVGFVVWRDPIEEERNDDDGGWR